ncbi:hypothetical protein E2562_026257 [Oryza meyeriana var. granulata]|uniref:Uncharacterized protein n=1 Tax=Oryza meyeriana var. granulata TaxID=110450 RepID=A0A6G1CIN4_9ORYZ|nr:hypothetical protein E2562_026257 [Oryza meyeriana var. granulata]
MTSGLSVFLKFRGEFSDLKCAKGILNLGHTHTHLHHPGCTLLRVIPPLVCTLHHRGLTPHLTSLHQGTRATSIRASNLTTLRRRRRRHRHHMTIVTTTVVMRVLELDSLKDVWLLFAAVACWRSAASKEKNIICSM